jgi:hypothetical protein
LSSTMIKSVILNLVFPVLKLDQTTHHHCHCHCQQWQKNFRFKNDYFCGTLFGTSEVEIFSGVPRNSKPNTNLFYSPFQTAYEKSSITLYSDYN